MRQIILIFLLLTVFSIAVCSQTKKIDSVFTGLGEKNCKTVKEDSFSRGECPGFAAYKLEVTDSGERQDLNVIFPDGSKRELDFYNNVSPGFSAFGEKAEWRVNREKMKPFALIVRFDINEEPAPQKIKSHLVIVKISPDSACITGIVKPTVRNQNVTARRLADNAPQKPCLAKAPIPKLIEELADENESVANSASAALIKIGPAVIAPLTESLQKQKLCEFQFMAAEIIRKIDKQQPVVKSTLFDVARGKCEYRYNPEKYLPDANFGSIISMFNAAQILATEIDGGISLIPEIMKEGGVGLIGGTRALGFVIMGIEDKKKKKEAIKPEVINAMKAVIPMLAEGLENKNGRMRCDFYDLLVWMQKSGFAELQTEANRALQGKTVNCAG